MSLRLSLRHGRMITVKPYERVGHANGVGVAGDMDAHLVEEPRQALARDGCVSTVRRGRRRTRGLAFYDAA
jgi:hypothetical protein